MVCRVGAMVALWSQRVERFDYFTTLSCVPSAAQGSRLQGSFDLLARRCASQPVACFCHEPQQAASRSEAVDACAVRRVLSGAASFPRESTNIGFVQWGIHSHRKCIASAVGREPASRFLLSCSNAAARFFSLGLWLAAERESRGMPAGGPRPLPPQLTFRSPRADMSPADLFRVQGSSPSPCPRAGFRATRMARLPHVTSRPPPRV